MRLESHKQVAPLTSPATSITGDYYENVARHFYRQVTPDGVSVTAAGRFYPKAITCDVAASS